MADYFEDDEVFQDINTFYNRLVKRMFKEMGDFQKTIDSGKLKGTWDIKPIDKPSVKGYVAHGRFHIGNEPLQMPKSGLEQEMREPLTDVFAEDDAVKIYMELPGVEKSDVQLNVTERLVEVRAKDFAKTVELPTVDMALDQATASYKNGVLVVAIPKLKKPGEDEKKRSIKIE
jgi:HSP20 family molecular chaperone IbpA